MTLAGLLVSRDFGATERDRRMGVARSRLVPRQLVLVAVLLVGVTACADDDVATRQSTATATTPSWAFPNHDLSNTRNAQDSLITSETIGRLGVAWTAQ
jgi:hypothetical protein